MAPKRKVTKPISGKAGVAIQTAAIAAQSVAATGTLGSASPWVMLGVAVAQAVAAVFSDPVKK